MGKSNKRRLMGITLIVVASVLLVSCDLASVPTTTMPTPTASNGKPTAALSTRQTEVMPTQPADNTQHIIQQLQANLAAANIQSYVITETNRARQVVQAHVGMAVAPVITGAEQLQSTTQVWYQQPDRWRVEISQTQAADPYQPFSWPPVEVSDGKQVWQYDPENKIAHAQPFDPHNSFNIVGSNEIITRTAEQLIGLNSGCYSPPTYEGSDTVLGRPTYMISQGGIRCPAPILPQFMGKRTLWFDQQTGLLLKDVLYEASDYTLRNRPNDNPPLATWQVTGLQLNVAINPATFSFTLPSGTNVVDIYAFHQPYPTPDARQSSPNAPLTVAEARQELNFPIFIPTNVPAGLTANPPVLNSEGPVLESLQIFYLDRKGQYRFEVINSTPDQLGNLAAQANETVTLANGITAYYRNDDTLYWEQDGTYVAIGAGPDRSAVENGCPSLLGKQQLIKIANSMSKTADLNSVQAQPTTPPTVLGQLRQQVCYAVFVPTDLPTGLTAAPPRFGTTEAEVSGIIIEYYSRDGALVLSVSNSEPRADYRDPFAMNVQPITLPNGISASFYTRPTECGYGRTVLYWEQGGTFIAIEGPALDGGAGSFQISKEELIKIATSMSGTAEPDKVEQPTAHPTFLPEPEETAPTCPTEQP